MVFDKETNAFQGAAMAVFVDHPSDRGGATALFSAIDVPDTPVNTPEGPVLSDFLFAGVADTDAISVFERTTVQNERPKLDNVAQLNSGNAALVGFTGVGEFLCNDCDFLTWGLWATVDSLNFRNGDDPASNVDAIGWWVSADIVKDVAGALPTTGTAYYNGTAIGEVWNNTSEVPARYTARGDMFMDWNFASRTGTFEVTKFDKKEHGGLIPGGIDFGGDLSAPGVPTGKLNQFSGGLGLTRGPQNLQNLTGTVAGSFVGATKLPGNVAGNPKGVIGNWSIGNSNYKAGGIFAGSESRPQ